MGPALYLYTQPRTAEVVVYTEDRHTYRFQMKTLALDLERAGLAEKWNDYYRLCSPEERTRSIAALPIVLRLTGEVLHTRMEKSE